MTSSEGIKSLFEDEFLKRDIGGSVASHPDIALTELVANSWDAGATRVDIHIPLKYNEELWIKDNGIGMDSDDFKNHWMKIRYNRLKDQGSLVSFPSDATPSSTKRMAYGKNGVGRHGMLCFNEEYRIESKKENCEPIAFLLTTKIPGEPIYARPFSNTFTSTHGTKLSVKVIHSLPKIEEIQEIISSRFLYDPQFDVYVNGTKLNFEQYSGFIQVKELDLLLESKPLHLKINFIDIKKYKNSNFNGIAFWNSKRLVGKPSWTLGNKMILDARHAQAKRFSFVVETEGLDNYIKEDWSGFIKSKEIDSVFEKVEEVITSCFREYNLNNIETIKKEVSQDLGENWQNTSLLVKAQVDEMISQTLTDNPQVSRESVIVAAKAVINLGKANRGQELLVKLSHMSTAEIDSLDRLLTKWTIRDALTVLDEIDKRLTVIEAIRKLSDDKTTDELHVLHPLLTEARWVFGPEYDTSEYLSNRQLQTVMKTVFKDKWDKKEDTNFKKRPDLLISGDFSLSLTGLELYDSETSLPKVKRLLLIELKRGGFEITREERNQVQGYAEDLIANFKDKELQINAFVVGTKLADNILRSGSMGENNSVHLYTTTFSQLVDAAEHRLFGLRKKLAEMYDEVPGMELYKQSRMFFKG